MSSSPSWQVAIEAEWAKRREEEAAESPTRKIIFPLAANPFGEEEIVAMTDVLLSGRLTLGARVEAAEREFAEAVGSPFSVMVNSGSSANLLMLSAIVNPQRSSHCKPGDEVLVPAVCWSTSVAPLLQLGLVPVFVDVDPSTFNVTVESLESAIQGRPDPRKVRVLMAVHVLGNSAPMAAVMNFVERYNLILCEDTCESLGSFAIEVPGNSKKKMLGTFGAFGAFSFYFSHHITSGEGGMVTCQTKDDYNFLRCLRAHGWTRHLTDRAEVESQHPDIDPRFLFVNVGYNLRPMEVQGAMLSVQLRKLTRFNECRRDNLARIEAALTKDPRFASHMSLMRAAEGTDPAWFGIGVVLHRSFAHQLKEYVNYLDEKGIENRPVISGNFARQPLIKAYLPDLLPEDFPGAEVLHTRGFFIGVHQIPVESADISELVEVMLAFNFQARHVVLVTGGSGMLGNHVASELKRIRIVPSESEKIHRAASASLPFITHGTGIGPGGGKIDFQEAQQNSTQMKWVFAGREDGDLRDLTAVESLFKLHQPTHVLHLAASLQSLNEMTTRPVDFWLDNVACNNNILSTAFKFQSWCGPIRVVSVLSTVMFPKDSIFPVDAAQAVSGTLHPAGEAYAAAKRELAALSRWYNTQHGTNFSCVLPGNFFGAKGDFAPATAPLINALIAKSYAAREAESSSLSVMGTGKPLRQIMWAGDLARIMLWAIEHLQQSSPLIVAGPELSISDIATMVAKATGFTGELVFDTNAIDGALRRTADTDEFEELCPEFEFTPLSEGLEATLKWYRSHHVQQNRSQKE